MMILVGFAVGYYVGSQAGHDAVDELVTAVQEIRSSEEFKALQTSALMMASEYLRSAVTPKNDRQREMIRSLVGEAAGMVQRRVKAVA